MKIIFMGPPGSGKGTYASRLGAKLGIPHISTGDLFREHVKNGTAIGKKVDAIMKSGKLVPDSIVLEVVRERISRPDCAKGYILDGFPRTIEQAKALDKVDKINAAVNIIIPDEWVITRMTSRRTCRGCGKIYNTMFLKPKKEGVCDVCGGELYVRADENEEVIKERLQVYKELSKPLIGFYKEKGALREFRTPSIDVPPEEAIGMISKMVRK